MTTAVQSRRDRGVFTAIVAVSVLGLSCAALEAAAAEGTSAVSVNMAALGSTAVATSAAAPTTTGDRRPGVIIKDGVVTMLPVGNSAPALPVSDSATAQPARAASPAKLVLRRATEEVSARPDSEYGCLATAIYFEARGESRKGQEAVAEVILARVRAPDRPKTICGVVYEGTGHGRACQFSFACDRNPDVVREDAAWTCAQEVASAELQSGEKSDLVPGATYYHANYVRPSWASHMIKVAQIGSHIFYKPRNA